MTSQMNDIEIAPALAEKARAGDLSAGDLEVLDRADILSLGMLADEVRRTRVGEAVTYVRVLDLGPGEAPPAGPVSSGEVRLMAPGESLEATVRAVAGVREAVGGGVRLSGFSLADLAGRQWGPLRDMLTALAKAGLDAVAEAPVDRIAPADLAALRDSGVGLGTLSVQRLSPEGRVALLTQARACVAAAPPGTAFAPLAREQAIAAPTTGYQDVRLVALARLALPGVRTIQVDWRQYGPKLAQVALTFGANHLDRVSAADDPDRGRRRSTVEEVRRNIAAAGFTPVEQGPGL